MKIKLNGFEFLKQRFLNEGNELVTHGEDIYLNEEADGAFPRTILDALGISLDKGPERYRLLKFFNKDFSPQTIIALPLRGLMGNDLGYDTEVGIACRFVSSEPDIFMNETLIETLQEMNYTGFVYAAYNEDLCSFGLGAGMAFYNVLESVEGTLVDFLSINDRLLESWTLSILLTRYPYPFKLKADNIAFKVFPQAQKHLHLWDCQQNKNLFYTSNTKLGVACSWATTLLEAEKRVLRTLDGLEIPQKQHRRDIASSVNWFEVKNQVMTS